MAKSKEEINKAHAIREALRANRDKSPSEIADLLKAKGVDVNGQYVSKIKGSMLKTSKAVRKTRRGIQQAGRNSKLGGDNNIKNGLQVINAAVELLKVAGGMDQAKSALATVEEIGKAMQ
ncbi:MAG: hypothetical protein O2955_14455 [Planctomycetota bacterium]|nr:hypothetical protein [Planctomycetota bacterium]MDA1213714.1 hypothetical protein [Planctomycetota bacterium]